MHNAVHCVISANDALLGYRHSLRSSGQSAAMRSLTCISPAGLPGRSVRQNIPVHKSGDFLAIEKRGAP